MALIVCKECNGSVSDTAAACPHCGAPVSPVVATLAAAPVEVKKGGSVWKWILGLPIALFALLMVIGGLSSGGNSDSGKYSSKAQAIERECDKMMSDSTLGNERRMTREICDNMRAQLRK